MWKNKAATSLSQISLLFGRNFNNPNNLLNKYPHKHVRSPFLTKSSVKLKKNMDRGCHLLEGRIVGGF
jgi:hypothetical protein